MSLEHPQLHVAIPLGCCSSPHNKLHSCLLAGSIAAKMTQPGLCTKSKSMDINLVQNKTELGTAPAGLWA